MRLDVVTTAVWHRAGDQSRVSLDDAFARRSNGQRQIRADVDEPWSSYGTVLLISGILSSMESPADLQPTFVITRDGDVDLYKTVALASSGMEAIDVRGGEYEAAFGIDGERLEILIDGYGVRLEATGGYDLPRLRERLRALAERNGYSGEDPDPRTVANEVFANEWRARWPRWPRWLDQRLHGDGPPRV